MYPKPIQDLAGWNIKYIGTGYTSIIVAADDTVIAWGASPCYGELGLGDMQKTSTVPKEVRDIAKNSIFQRICRKINMCSRCGSPRSFVMFTGLLGSFSGD